MKTNTKRILSLLLALVLLCGMLVVPAGAATTEAQNAAKALYELGLFKGSGTLPDGRPNFDLDNTATRAQAAVMVTRLFGGEEEARSNHYSHPFTDADWASDYIGYVYTKGITKGESRETFGTNNQIPANQFLTFILRALGYSEVDWQNPYPLARSVGLTYTGVNNFRRGDMAVVCYSALSCKVSGTGRTLLQQLEAQGAVPTFTPGPVTPTAASRYTIPANASVQDIQTLLLPALEGRAAKVEITAPTSKMADCDSAISTLHSRFTDITDCSWSGVISGSNLTITLTPTYTDAVEIMAYLEGKRSSLSNTDAQTLAKAQQVHASLVKPGMNEYNQVKAFHDYLVNFITYQETGTRSHNAAGALVDGRAVCDGYAVALDLLCYLSGIECVRVTGTANGAHAWNKVKVNGNWYNIDVTWDDIGSYMSYDYFLISDSAISRDHRFDTGPNWPAAPANYGR